MRVGVIGRSQWTYDSMVKLYEGGFDIAFIVTCKEAPEYIKTSSDFELFAKEKDIPFLYNPRVTANDLKKILSSGLKVDICISINYSGVIPQDVIDLFDNGILNAHGGDLPKYRGNACQAWAILNREERIGLCIHKMIGGELDSGDIIERSYYDVSIDTRIGQINEWMNREIPGMMYKAIQKLQKNSGYILETQSKNPADSLRCYPRNSNDGKINWLETNEDILRLINASSEPYAGAFCYSGSTQIRVWRANLFHDDEMYLAVPGQIAAINSDKSIIVITGKGKLKITEVSIEEPLVRLAPGNFLKSIRQRLE